MTAQNVLHYDPLTQEVTCLGNWELVNFPKLKISLTNIHWPNSGKITINGGKISKMDSTGAWLLCELEKKLEHQGLEVYLQNFSKEYQSLLSIINKNIKKETELPQVEKLKTVTALGKYSVNLITELQSYLAFVGLLAMETVRVSFSPKHLRWNSFANILYKDGYLALPIIALLSFMIGVVIAYQLGIQLRNYGANIYIVDFVGLSMLREFGPLLTAIIVAGRTGSSFTAQLGMMKLNQEIDALNTMGVTPAELLILPRITGLFIALPLITMWADIFGVLGGMIMSNSMLNITFTEFLHRFPHVVKLKNLLIGLGKAPVFALIISSIGCFQGMQVQGSAESVGQHTTRSVVLAIFFIIVADAIFSVIFSKLKL